MSFWRKKKEPDSKSRSGSFAFYFSIPANFLLACLFLGETALFINVRGETKGASFLFFHAFLAGTIIISSLKAPRFRTLIHELKHAAMVVMTGNKLRSISVGNGEGHVIYDVYKNVTHLLPFIKLAPYFFPLLSLPIFVLAFIFEGESRSYFIYALGFLFGVDLATGYKEIHGMQSDLRRVYGGFLVTRTFIFSAHLLWFSIIFLWIVGGRNAYLFLLESLSVVAKVLE